MGKTTKMKRPSIPLTVSMELWSKAGGRCEFEGCNEELWVDNLTWTKMNRSNIAHIISWTPTGPRGNEKLSPQLATDVSNLMLTCQKHNKLIDSSEYVNEYSVECLREMKKKHETRIKIATSVLPENKSKIIIYGANIGDKAIHINNKDTAATLLPKFYPDGEQIKLTLYSDSWNDNEPKYWEIQKEHLEKQFNKIIKPQLQDGTIKHLSIFGFAPQPLLIYFGYLLSDKYPANVFQLNREFGNWEWRKENIDINYQIIEPVVISKTNSPVLNISLSGRISNDRIESKINQSDIWTFTIKNPNPDFLEAYNQLYIFKKEFRFLLDKIKQNYPEGTPLNLFTAMPISTCIELGRLILPKTDMPLHIYNQTNTSAGFELALTIEGEK